MESELISGLYFKRKRPGAPDFVKLTGSIKVADLQAFLAKQGGKEWVNFDVLLSKNGEKLYPKVNTWEPQEKQAQQMTPQQQFEAQTAPEVKADELDIPF